MKPSAPGKKTAAKNKTFGAQKANFNKPASNKSPINKKRAMPKKALLDSAPKKEVKEMFMAWFRKHKTVGAIMSKQDVVTNILKKIDAKQENALADAMNELKSEGFIEVQPDGVTLVLTQLGVDYL
ncbi:MAG: hypothetical protein PHU40_10190 [Sulfurimonas sp.]|nr:hypothetical protein [Sulfurimonas sp.]